MSLEFYDRHGQARLYTEDGETLYTWDGDPVAYLFGDDIYLFDGEHFGRFKHGWILDDEGYHVLFSKDAMDGPLMPMMRPKPFKQMQKPKPFKHERGYAPEEAMPKDAWAEYAW